MNFWNMELFDLVAQKALAEYGLADSHELKLLHRSENITYAVVGKTEDGLGDGTVYSVLRVGRPGYHTTEESEAEICWMKQIASEGEVIIAAPMDNQRGQAVTQVTLDGITYDCVMCEYVTGEAPDPFDRDRGLVWFRQAGETAARLHRQAMNWKEGERLCRPVWDYEALLGEQALFGNWRMCRELGQEGYEILTKTCDRIRDRLLAYGRERERFGLIHSDLRAANLLVEDGRMKVLDFDDCGYGWHLHDLAASISFIEDRPEAASWVEAWIEGYRTCMPFDQKDRREVDTFIMARRIQLLAWITSHDDSDPVKVYEDGFVEKTIGMARKYRKGSGVGWI